MHPGVLHRRFLSDLSTSLFSFVLPLLPTSEELTIKEEVRTLIEKLIKTIEPSSRLLSFGSSCNSFGLRNSDMDLVVLIDDPDAGLDASTFVQMIGDLLERETNFDVKPLPKARIPIIKLNLAASPGLPYGIACDIGIENRLAIENTRLLLTYATIDPARVRTLVLFLKVWAKRRRINSPYRGTLSSYGITLMVLYFLVHVKQPPVLPNLQRIAPVRPITEEEMMLEGRNVYFFDDVEMLRQEWSSVNFESVGELLIDFFRYFSHDFQFNTMVLSLRAGPLTKESKGWTNDIDVGGLNEMARDRNRLCIEDPFEITYNVARTVTKDGLYTIRGEFMRATRILTQRPERAVLALAELCRERDEELLRAPRSASPAPRTLNVRAPFNGGSSPGWRSQSQQPHDRYAGERDRGGERASDRGTDRYDRHAADRHPAHNGSVTPVEPTHARRGRQSDQGPASAGGPGGANMHDERWMQQSHPGAGGSSAGGSGGGGGGSSLGLGGAFNEPASSIPDFNSSRGRDPVPLHRPSPLDTNHPRSNSGRRGTASYDNPNAVGTVSAPLSPSRLYAQLEIGRGAGAGAPQWGGSGYEQRGAFGAPGGGPTGVAPPAGGPSTYAAGGVGAAGAGEPVGVARGRVVSGSRDLSMPPSQLHLSHSANDPASPLPAFAPFSPPVLNQSLHPSAAAAAAGAGGAPAAAAVPNGTGDAAFISPSTLLSPQPAVPPLPADQAGSAGMEGLAMSFGQLGVDVGKPAGAAVSAEGDLP